MTSMPASRSAAATTFAPRSWPSRPGLATRTRMGRIVPVNLAGAPSARQLAPTCHEQHLPRATAERAIPEAVVRLFHHEAGVETQLGEPRGGIQADAVLASARPGRA